MHYLYEGSAEAPQRKSSESECATTLVGTVDARGQKNPNCEQEFRRRRKKDVLPRRRENASGDKKTVYTFEHARCEGSRLCRSATLPLYKGLSRAPRHNVNLLGSAAEHQSDTSIPHEFVRSLVESTINMAGPSGQILLAYSYYYYYFYYYYNFFILIFLICFTY